MDYPKLKDELALPAYDGLTDAEAAAALNELTVPVLTQRWVSARTLYDELGPTVAESILGKIDAAAGAGSATMRRVAGWLNEPSGQYPGIDVGSAKVQAMIDSLAGTLLTEAEADAVKGLGITMISRADELGIIGRTETLEEKHIRKARSI